MDPGLALLIGEALKTSISLYLAHQRLAGKTEEEARQMFLNELDKAMAFDPKNDIKDV
jgi:hypothetical protein